MKTLFSLLIVTCFLIQVSDTVIYDFKEAKSTEGWYVVDDGVMGGLSKGSIKINDQGYAEYSGYVTTENNGGFSSVRYAFETTDVSDYSKIILRIKGDGKSYQFRIKESPYQRFSYIQNFISSGEWETIEIPLEEFYPYFRGYRLNRSNFSGQEMGEIAFLIGNKVKEEFRLEIESIWLR
ncbi:MAG: CIA30 family protein [Bacteroidia bacterium]|nr:CIA30 family protein [Bacteroidia bacterium]MBT8269119.1 CIA30 family protein [Bacteroidia bacterium]